MGRLTVSLLCSIHKKTVILSPFTHTSEDHLLDVIPQSRLDIANNVFSKLIKDVLPQHFSNVGLFSDLLKLTKESLEVIKLNKVVITNFLLNLSTEYHIILLYVCIVILAIFLIVLILFVKYKKREVRVYTTEIAETQA